MVWACIEKRRRICRQESDGDGGAGEKKERKTKAEVPGLHQERLVGERIGRGGCARPGEMEASHKTHRPHIGLQVGKYEDEEEDSWIKHTIIGTQQIVSASTAVI